MSFATFTCHTLVCDKCGDPLENGDGTTLHFPDGEQNDACDYLDYDDWHTAGDKHWHDRCTPRCTCGHPFHAEDDPCEWEDDCPCEHFVPLEDA